MNKPKQIFIVEDNEVFSMMLDYILSTDSIYNFVSFKTGEECVKNLYMNPDIIILDYGLPGINGYETLKEIKKRSPHTHVIILSNNKDKNIAAKLLALGADDYILKQGHGETQVIKRIEHVLKKDEQSKRSIGRNAPLVERWVVFILIIITVGFFISRVV
ncbi:MAG TPA: response regulator [Bacteroidia bacterium]|jgi:DNA-binding NarL/FixJ family response regulator